MRAPFIVTLSAVVVSGCTQFGPDWDQSAPGDLPVRTWGSGTVTPPPPGEAAFRSKLGPPANLWWDSIGSEVEVPDGPLTATGTLGFSPSVVFDGKAIGVGAMGPPETPRRFRPVFAQFAAVRCELRGVNSL